ncbi:A-kinase-interacting protein 1 [Dendrobates tinctorius]|uniref:A-kinase-interacting protein 1 n=1 Tax=Dendrobates tinctorius TaxID=92724 RepID=UPI003CCA130B
MEDSLRRTSALGQEVLERARRRDVDWWSVRTHSGHSPRIRHSTESPEAERPSSLEEAFSTLSCFMRQTTEQCERYHSCIPAPEMSRSEVQHVCRIHCRRRQRVPGKPPPPASSSTAGPFQSSVTSRDPRDISIEVAPGTYSISASSSNYHKQTHLLNITPGQSVDLTFTG